VLELYKELVINKTMSAKFIRNWAIVTVLTLVLTLIWHVVLFAGDYGTHLSMIGRYVGDAPTPLFGYFLIAHILVALGFVRFLPHVSRGSNEYAMNGVIMGWATFGVFAVLSHALFANWGGWLMMMDVGFGTVAGLITGWVMSKLA